MALGNHPGGSLGKWNPGDGFTNPSSTNVWIAQQTFSTGINLSGGQIIFPATQVPSAGVNTLDDYEEGTFTPTLADTSLDGTGEMQTYTDQAGFYTKIGNRVLFNLYLHGNSIGTLSSSEPAYIMGLPFTSSPTDLSFASVYVGYTASLAITANQSVAGYVDNNQSYISLALWDDSGGITEMTVGEFSTGGLVYVSGHYFV